MLFFVPASPSWAGFLALRASIYAPTAFKADYVISLARIPVGNAIVRPDIDSHTFAVSASGHRDRVDPIVWTVRTEGDNRLQGFRRDTDEAILERLDFVMAAFIIFKR